MKKKINEFFLQIAEGISRMDMLSYVFAYLFTMGLSLFLPKFMNATHEFTAVQYLTLFFVLYMFLHSKDS